MTIKRPCFFREERDVLTEALSRVRAECGELKHHSEQMEARYLAAERVVAALRDALKDERAAKNRAEAQCSAIAKVTCVESISLVQMSKSSSGRSAQGYGQGTKLRQQQG